MVVLGRHGIPEHRVHQLTLPQLEGYLAAIGRLNGQKAQPDSRTSERRFISKRKQRKGKV